LADELVLDAPFDLNFLWALAHVGGWCPYGLLACDALGDPLVSALAAAYAKTGEHLPQAASVARAWEAQVRVRNGPDRYSPGAVGAVCVRENPDPVWRPTAPFEAFWRADLGLRWALEYWLNGFVECINAGRPSHRAFQMRASLARIDVVGTEDAVHRTDRCVVAGVRAMRSPEHLLSLLAR
jgi:hypothetical protein